MRRLTFTLALAVFAFGLASAGPASAECGKHKTMQSVATGAPATVVDAGTILPPTTTTTEIKTGG